MGLNMGGIKGPYWCVNQEGQGVTSMSGGNREGGSYGGHKGGSNGGKVRDDTTTTPPQNHKAAPNCSRQGRGQMKKLKGKKQQGEN